MKPLLLLSSLARAHPLRGLVSQDGEGDALVVHSSWANSEGLWLRRNNQAHGNLRFSTSCIANSQNYSGFIIAQGLSNISPQSENEIIRGAESHRRARR